MSASDTSGFGKFIPGFDFLQNLSKSASGMPQMPNLANWVAPTLSVEELDKRIDELKNVHFWLEQNARALAATVQALEVQKMTMATLKGMNFNLADVASALQPRATSTPAAAAPPARPASASAASKASASGTGAPEGPSGAPAMVDPLQLWGALTQQFQHIAASAVQHAAAASQASAPVAAASAATAAAGKKVAARKTPVRRAPPAGKAASGKAGAR